MSILPIMTGSNPSDPLVSILYVDDEPALLEIFRLFLERTGEFSVTTAESAAVALDLLASRSFDAVVSDYQMPGMDGIAFLKHLRTTGDTTPFIIFTGKGREEVVIQALNEGADFYLQKGGDPKSQFAELTNKIRYAVSSRRFERGVSEAGERYKALIAVSNTGAWEYTLGSDFLWCSPEYFSMLGRDAADFDLSGNPNLQETWINLIHPDDQLRAADTFRDFLESNSSGMYENDFRMAHADGRMIWIWSRGWRLRDERGNLTDKTIGTHIDVTERKEAEDKLIRQTEELHAAYEQLTASEEELRHQLDELTVAHQALDETNEYLENLITHANAPIIVWDQQCRITRFNDAFSKMTGIQPDDAIGSRLELLFPEESRDASMDLIRRAMAGEMWDVVEIPILNRSGAVRTVLWNSANIRGTDGKTIIATIAQGQDITDRKRTEEALTASEAQKDAILNGIGINIAFVNHDLEILWANKTAAASVNRDQDGIRGLRCYELWGDNQGPCPKCPTTKAFQTLRSEQTVIQTPDGRYWDERAEPVFDAEGRLTGIVEIAQDITEQKLAELALLQKTEELHQKNEELAASEEEMRTAHEQLAASEEEIRQQLDELIATQQQLALSEGRYQAIFECTRAATVIVEKDTTISLANSAFEALSGYTREELIGRSWTEFVSQSDRKRMIAYHQQRRAGESGEGEPPGQYEFTFIDRSGTPHATLATVGLIPGTSQSVGSFYDISDRKAAEEALLESEGAVRRKLQAILEPEGSFGELELSDILNVSSIQDLMDYFHKLTGIGVAILDRTGRVLVATGWQDICTRFHREHPETARHCLESDTELASGVAQGEFKRYRCKNNMWDIATPISIGEEHVGNLYLGQFLFEGEEPDREVFRRQAERYGFDEEQYLAALDRVPRWTEETVDTVMRFYAGFTQIISSLSYANLRLARELSEKDDLMSRLAASEEQYRRIVDTSAEGIWQMDAGFQITYVNRQLADMLGYTPAEMSGMDIAALIPPEERADSELRRERQRRGEVDHFERKLIRKDGQILWTSVAITPIIGADGEYQGSFAMVADISGRKAAEDALLSEEARLRAITETAKDAILMMDPEGKISFWNQTAEDIFGYTKDEVMGTDLHTLLAPERYLDAYTRGFASFQKTGEGTAIGRTLELEAVCKDGREIVIELSLSALGLPDGWHAVGIIRDITERKLVEEKNRAIASMLDIAPGSITIHDYDGNFHFANQKTFDIHGYSKDEFLSKKLADIDFPSSAELIGERMQQIAQDGEASFEVAHRRKDGSVVSLEVFVKEVEWEGKPALLSIATDITGRKAAEDVLRKSEALKSHIIDAIPDILFILDSEGRFIDAMASDEDLLVAPKTELPGKTIVDLIPGPDGRRMAEAIAETLQHQDMVTIEYALSVPAGICHFEARIVPYLDNQVLALVRDVTETKAAEEALLAAHKKLRILSSITRHDIANKVLVIRGLLEIAGEAEASSAPPIRLDEIQNATEAIDRQIAFMQDYEQIGVQNPSWMELSGLIRMIDETKLSLHHTCTSIHLYADPMVEKVFSNLHDNTIRHADGGDQITISCEERDGSLVITWEDNGVGIPDGEKEKIFEKGVGKNTGFGLFLSKEILEITGIAIRETGVYGEGARFEIIVPKGSWQMEEQER